MTSSFNVCGVFMEISWHIFTFFVTFWSLAVVQKLGISTQGWLVFNCTFRFGVQKRTQILSGLKKVVFFLYYIHTTYMYDAQTHRRKVAHCLYKVCG